MSAAINIIQSAALLALGTAQLILWRRVERIEQAALARSVSKGTLAARLQAAESALYSLTLDEGGNVTGFVLRGEPTAPGTPWGGVSPQGAPQDQGASPRASL